MTIAKPDANFESGTSPQQLVAGRYRLLEQIGSGRLGDIYAAEDVGRLELGIEERVAVHDVATWTQLAERRDRPVLNQVALSPVGDLLAALDDTGALVLLRPATLEILTRVPSPDGGAPRAIAWSPDGTRVAVARRGTLGTEIWDIAHMRARLEALGLDWD